MSALLEMHEAARRLHISVAALHYLVDRGTIPAQRTSRDFKLIRPEDIDGLELGYEEIDELIQRKQRQGSHTNTVMDRKEFKDGASTYSNQ